MSDLRRSFLGNRSTGTDEAIASRDARIDELEAVARRLSERVVERERELRELREQLADERARGEEGVRSLAALARQLEEVRAQARGQATRIRIRALRDAAELSERLSELAKRPGEAGGQLLEAVQDAIRRLSDGDSEQDPPAAVESNGRALSDPSEVFEGLVQVEVGPLRDFSQLASFEDAANEIDAASEISIKRFSGGRATLAMHLQEPVRLLRELEERCDLEFKLRSLRGDRVVLEVEEDGQQD